MAAVEPCQIMCGSNRKSGKGCNDVNKRGQKTFSIRICFPSAVRADAGFRQRNLLSGNHCRDGARHGFRRGSSSGAGQFGARADDSRIDPADGAGGRNGSRDAGTPCTSGIADQATRLTAELGSARVERQRVAAIRAVREGSRDRTRSVRSRTRPRGYSTIASTESPVRPKIHKHRMSVTDARFAHHRHLVVMSEASALRLTDLKSASADFVAMTESPCTDADSCNVSALKPIQNLLAQS
jgi:hypothetical protein